VTTLFELKKYTRWSHQFKLNDVIVMYHLTVSMRGCKHAFVIVIEVHHSWKLMYLMKWGFLMW